MTTENRSPGGIILPKPMPPPEKEQPEMFDTSGKHAVLHRVAYAIGKATTPNWSDGHHWCMNTDSRQRLYGAARAAIEVMREPTEAMILDGAKADADQHYYKQNALTRCVDSEFHQDWLNGAKHAWIAMIGAALAE